jgi:hypothetical protein
MREELLRPDYVLVSGETKTVKDLPHLVVGLLHSSRKGNLRIAREQLCLARPLPAALNGVTLGFGVNRSIGRRLSGRLTRPDGGYVNQSHTRLPQRSADCRQVVRGQVMAGKGLVDHLKREIAPLGGQPQQFDDLLRDVETGLGLEEPE